MRDHGLDDGVVRLQERADDAAWYADSVRDPLVQRFTAASPALDAGQVLAAIARLRAARDVGGFVICGAVAGERLGNIALRHGGRAGEVWYWVAAGARGRGVDEDAMVEFLAARQAAGRRRDLDPRAMMPLLSYLRDAGVTPAAKPPHTPLEGLLGEYRIWLVRERGPARPRCCGMRTPPAASCSSKPWLAAS